MEASKSKFVYPDKLYARCKDNKTLDMSYVPQNMEAVEYTRTDAFIEKAIGWIDYNNRNGGCNFDGWKEDFKKSIEKKVSYAKE